MAELVETPGENFFITAVKIIINYGLRFISYMFLTFSVAVIVAILLVIATTAFGDSLSFEFLKHFAFVNPIFGQESMSLGLKEVMQLYLALSLGMSILVEILKFILKKVFKKEIIISIKRKIVYGMIFVSIVFIAAFISVPFMNMAEGETSSGFYVVFAIFYVLTLISTTAYIGMNELAKKISAA